VVPGGIEAVRAQLRSEALERFFEQRFLPASWYDALPAQWQSAAAARAAGTSFAQMARGAARAQAQRDLQVPHRLLWKIDSVDQVLARLSRVLMEYFDFGKAAVVDRVAGKATLLCRGVPELVVPWFCAASDGFVSLAFEAAGARDIRMRAGKTERDGEVGGMATVQIPFELRWR